MSKDRKRGVPINEEYFLKRPSISKTLKSPEASENVREIYSFILQNRHYTVNRGVGMGMDVSVAPDMDKLDRRAKKKDIDIDRYEDYCFYFISKQSEIEQRKE